MAEIVNLPNDNNITGTELITVVDVTDNNLGKTFTVDAFETYLQTSLTFPTSLTNTTILGVLNSASGSIDGDLLFNAPNTQLTSANILGVINGATGDIDADLLANAAGIDSFFTQSAGGALLATVAITFEEQLGGNSLRIGTYTGDTIMAPYQIVIPGDSTFYISPTDLVVGETFIRTTPPVAQVVPIGTTITLQTLPEITTTSIFAPLLAGMTSNNDAPPSRPGAMYSQGGFVRVAGTPVQNVLLQSNNTNSSDSPDLTLRKINTPLVGNELGVIRWEGQNGDGAVDFIDNTFDYAEMWVQTPNVTDGQEEGALFIDLAHSGSEASADDNNAQYAFKTTGLTVPTLILQNVPTSNPGIPGAVWRDGTDLKISI